MLECLLCLDMGELIGEDAANNGRLWCWPCPYDCRAPGPSFVRITVTPEQARKATQRMLKRLRKNG